MNDQHTLDALLVIAVYESIFGPGEPALWNGIIQDLLDRGAVWFPIEVAA